MKTVQHTLSSILIDAALDHRIPDGIVDLGNAEHICVIAENMYNVGIDVDDINEFTKNFMDEGKYPDRQAFNKEGWLVTFPSQAYRDAAIKKGTHSVSDPTHGNGGMNLYYKKKGKQKRQTRQDATGSENEPSAVPHQSPKQPSQVANSTSSLPAVSDDDSLYSGVTDDEVDDAPVKNKSNNSEKTATPDVANSGNLPQETPQGPIEKSPKSVSHGTSTPPHPATTPTKASTPPYAKLSKQFATQKGWVATQFGEWRDAQGTSVAANSLSGEVVPFKNVDREELKLFVDKRLG